MILSAIKSLLYQLRPIEVLMNNRCHNSMIKEVKELMNEMTCKSLFRMLKIHEMNSSECELIDLIHTI